MPDSRGVLRHLSAGYSLPQDAVRLGAAEKGAKRGNYRSAFAVVLSFSAVIGIGMRENLCSQVVISSTPIGNQVAGELVVNPVTARVYIGCGIGQASLMVMDATFPAMPVILTSVTGVGCAILASLSRFYTSSGFGGQLLVYDGATKTLMGSANLGYCGMSLDADPDTRLV